MLETPQPMLGLGLVLIGTTRSPCPFKVGCGYTAERDSDSVGARNILTR